MTRPRVLGVDGWRGQWIAVELVGGRFEAAFVGSLDELVSRAPYAAVGVDVPIGLPEGSEPRSADVAARAFVGPRRSSVFTTPPAAVLDAPDYPSARAVASRIGAGVSAQAFALRHNIREAAAIVERGADVYEVHPEASFAAMKRGHLAWAKRTWNGSRERLALLAEAGIHVPDDLGDAGKAPPDDVLDAAAVAWTAARIAAGLAHRLGDAPPHIWA